MWMQLKISNDIITQNIPEVLDQQHLIEKCQILVTVHITQCVVSKNTGIISWFTHFSSGGTQH